MSNRFQFGRRTGGRRKTVVAALILLVLFWEVFGHWLWFARVSLPEQPADSTRLLLVADPQIQGFHREPPLALGYLTRWDVYGYLSAYVAAAFRLARPDEVVFLGDLLDEGSTASETEFSRYAHEFHRLFPRSAMPRRTFIAGDNDVGGEGDEVITEARAATFAEHFGPVNGRKSTRNGVSLVWVNTIALSESYLVESAVRRQAEDFVRDGRPDATAADTRRRRPSVLLLHYPMAYLAPERRRELLEAFDVALVLSAHEHRFAVTPFSRSGRARAGNGGRGHGPWPSSGGPWSRSAALTLTGDDVRMACGDGGGGGDADDDGCVLDVSVSTVSYRMGTPAMAVVVADIDATGRLQSVVLLPLPPRYPVIALYAGLVLLCAAILLCSRSRATSLFCCF